MYSLKQQLNDDARYLSFPYVELFQRIGMHHTWMETDHLGNFIGSSQIYTTARDLGRFGLLYLNDGVWNNQRLLPEGWTSFAATPAPSLPAEDGKQGYGAQFWLLDRLPGVPAGTYTSIGNKGQFATIVPAHNMVVVRTGVDPANTRWQQPSFVVDAIAAFAN
jgi:CubicO group peptidase (beta-lactamase class C family)